MAGDSPPPPTMARSRSDVPQRRASAATITGTITRKQLFRSISEQVDASNRNAPSIGELQDFRGDFTRFLRRQRRAESMQEAWREEEEEINSASSAEGPIAAAIRQMQEEDQAKKEHKAFVDLEKQLFAEVKGGDSSSEEEEEEARARAPPTESVQQFAGSQQRYERQLRREASRQEALLLDEKEPARTPSQQRLDTAVQRALVALEHTVAQQATRRHSVQFGTELAMRQCQGDSNRIARALRREKSMGEAQELHRLSLQHPSAPREGSMQSDGGEGERGVFDHHLLSTLAEEELVERARYAQNFVKHAIRRALGRRRELQAGASPLAAGPGGPAITARQATAPGISSSSAASAGPGPVSQRAVPVPADIHAYLGSSRGYGRRLRRENSREEAELEAEEAASGSSSHASKMTFDEHEAMRRQEEALVDAA